MAKAKGLYANIQAKRKRIAAGSGETMRKPGAKGAPTKANFVRSAKTAKKPVKKGLYYYMNKRKKSGTSRSGTGTVSAKALKRSAKTAKKPKKKTA